VSEPSSGKRRRRRPQRGAQRANAEAAGQPPRERAQPAANPGGKRRKRSARTDAAERSLRELVGAGPSQVGVSGALRARDVNRPTEQDLAEAERDVVLVRRYWKPPPPGADTRGSSGPHE
jgi:hypothetical protein